MKVKIIKKNSPRYGQIGEIVQKTDLPFSENLIKFDDNCCELFVFSEIEEVKNENIKVGQLARYKFLGCNKVFIDKIKETKQQENIHGVLYTLYKLRDWWHNDKYFIKTDDNLEDLLEVGDSVDVEVTYKVFNQTLTIKNKYIDSLKTLEYVQNKIRDKQWKITAIELHENRVKQVIVDKNKDLNL